MGNPHPSKATPEQPEGLRDLSGKINSKAVDLLDKGFGDVPQLSVLGFNPYEQASMQKLMEAFAAPNPLTGQATNYTADVLGGRYLDPATNPALAKSAEAISGGAQRFLDANLDQLGSNFALAGGASSSALANAKKSATVSSARGVADALAALYGNAYSQERGMQQSILPQASALANEPTQRLLAALGLGGTQRQMAQGQSDIGYTNYLNNANAQAMPLQLAIQALTGMSGTYQMPEYGPSELQQNLALAFGGVQAASSAYSASKSGGKK